MSYIKPVLGLLGQSIKAVQGQPGAWPWLKAGLFFQDAAPLQLFHRSLTIGAYEADE